MHGDCVMHLSGTGELWLTLFFLLMSTELRGLLLPQPIHLRTNPPTRPDQALDIPALAQPAASSLSNAVKVSRQ